MAERASAKKDDHHETNESHPVVSDLASTPSLGRVPVDSICALAYAVDFPIISEI